MRPAAAIGERGDTIADSLAVPSLSWTWSHGMAGRVGCAAGSRRAHALYGSWRLARRLRRANSSSLRRSDACSEM